MKITFGGIAAKMWTAETLRQTFESCSLGSEMFQKGLQKGLLISGEMASTNTYLLEHPEPHPQYCLALKQTAGRGRSGHGWVSERGSSLCLSIAHTLGEPLHRGPLLILMSALALAHLFEGMGHRVRVKWPNDLYLEDKKFAGFLLETRPEAEMHRWVLGLGLNVGPVTVPGRATASIFASPLHIKDFSLLALRIMHRLERAFQMFGHAAYVRILRRLGPRYDLWSMGTPLRWEGSQGNSVLGTYEGFAEDGQLKMRVDGILKTYASGEVRRAKEQTHT